MNTLNPPGKICLCSSISLFSIWNQVPFFQPGGGNSGVVYILELVVGIVRVIVLRCGEACELRRPRDVVWVVVMMVFLPVFFSKKNIPLNNK